MTYKHPSQPRLKEGDLVRVVSFGLSTRGITPTQRELCISNLARLGLRVSFGKHVDESDEFDSSSVESRIEDLHDALIDPEVKLVLSSLGGMNAAQILTYVDWELLRANPKMFCGFSDMAALVNAIHSKTGLVTYNGPFFGTFGMKQGLEYTLESFEKCLFTSSVYPLEPTETWSDDAWWADQENRTFNNNPGPTVLSEGEASGRLIGGHLTSFATLFGTEFAPDFSDSIVAIEENSEINPRSFDRLLQNLVHQKGFKEVKGLLIGRFTSQSGVTDEMLTRIVRTYPELSSIPVIVNLSFGHTYPQATLPIGGKVHMVAKGEQPLVNIVSH
ncbi:MAG TPA: S66 peptidase family protein [Candidatus Paceibacterota bacterium]